MNNYTLILGENPSKGARSPLLWNKTYEHFKINQKMYPRDIPLNSFEYEIPQIFEDELFLGGAVAVPYKEKIINFTHNKKEILDGPQAVNCLVRNEDKLFGYNTDGIATVSILEKKVKMDNLEQIILLGTGGMAKAVASELSKKYSKINMYIFDRYLNCLIFKNGELKKTKHRLDRSLNTILINCSSAGFINNVKIGKINKQILELHPFLIQNKIEHDHINQCINTLKSFKNLNFIFDVIYQPDKTLLLKIADYLGIRSKNGLEINLLQAAISFKKVYPNQKLNEIYEIMGS